MYAVIKTSGLQFLVSKGDKIKIPALVGEAGKELEFNEILMIKDDGGAVFGKPTINGAKVTGTVKKYGKSAKRIIYKFTRRESYRRKRGHRQDFTEVEITEITK
jgi:large subunit ribosomal protein L21